MQATVPAPGPGLQDCRLEVSSGALQLPKLLSRSQKPPRSLTSGTSSLIPLRKLRGLSEVPEPRASGRPSRRALSRWMLGWGRAGLSSLVFALIPPASCCLDTWVSGMGPLIPCFLLSSLAPSRDFKRQHQEAWAVVTERLL